MRIPTQGTSLLQEMQAQEDVEALNLPKLNAGSAAQRAGQRARHQVAHIAERQQIDLILETPLHKLHARLHQNKARKRGNAETPDAGTSASELDELLMQQEEFNNNKPYPVIRASSQKKNNGQGQQSGQSGQSDSQRHRQFLDGAAAAALDDVMRSTMAAVNVLNAVKDNQVSRYALLEKSLLQIRTPGSIPGANESLTYTVLHVMHEHLAQASTSDTAPATLAAVRQRLIELLPAAATDPNRAAAPTASALRQIHLFLPLLLLNAARPRTALQRTQALAKIAALLRRS